MLRDAVGRIVWTIPVVLLAVTLYQPPSIRSNIRRRYGLDLPWYEQYGNYLAGVATLSLGPSLSFRSRTVEEIVERQGPITLELTALAFAWALPFGIALGVGSGLARGPTVPVLERVLTAAATAFPA